jgi:hypothetical protein
VIGSDFSPPGGESRPPFEVRPAALWRGDPSPLDVALRTAGALIAVVAALVTAALELMLSTLRVGETLIGVAALVAIAANILLAWFAYAVVGRKWAVALPALAWFSVIFTAAGGTTEGDIGFAGNNWVGVAIVILGSLAFAAATVRMITVSARR